MICDDGLVAPVVDGLTMAEDVIVEDGLVIMEEEAAGVDLTVVAEECLVVKTFVVVVITVKQQ